jgi:hypothetical protein
MHEYVTILNKIQDAVLASEFYEDAASFRRSVMRSLTAAGFTCEREVPVGLLSNGRSGRIDVLAKKGATRVAFEIDRLHARRRSLEKLRKLDNVIRVVVLRDGPVVQHLGIDLVLSVRRPQQTPGSEDG